MNPLFSELLKKLTSPKPPLPQLPALPSWLVAETQQKIVLLLNHILMQEPAASTRLKRQAGRILQLEWFSFQHFILTCQITKAGLLDLAASDAVPDLKISLSQTPLLLFKDLANGATPALQIAGDVQLAAEMNWITQHTRWDVAEDVQRLFGPNMAALLAGIVRPIRKALSAFANQPPSPTH